MASAGLTRVLGCEVERAHLHVVPLDFLVVRAFDGYELERLGVMRAGESDFVLVNLFREPVGAPMRPDAINELMTAASQRAGFEPAIRPRQLRHAFGGDIADAGGALRWP